MKDVLEERMVEVEEMVLIAQLQSRDEGNPGAVRENIPMLSVTRRRQAALRHARLERSSLQTSSISGLSSLTLQGTVVVAAWYRRIAPLVESGPTTVTRRSD